MRIDGFDISERVKKYFRAALKRGRSNPPSPKMRNWTKAFFELHKNLPLAERQARSFAYALTREPVYIHPDCHIAGQIYQTGAGSGCPEFDGWLYDRRWEKFSAVAQAENQVRSELPDNAWYGVFFNDGASPGHICWDFGVILKEGTSGLKRECDKKLANAPDPEAAEFFRCVKIVLDGLDAWVKLHKNKLTEMLGKSRDINNKARLERMLSICEKVPANPAGSFQEAVQSFYFQHLAVMYENPFGGNGPGRLDYYLWSYLEKDLEARKITMSYARDLVTELFIKLDERIHLKDDWVEAVPVGGRKPDGSLSVNPLSTMMLDIIEHLEISHPSVYVRLPDDAPAGFVDKSIEYLIRGGNRAQIYGDDRIIEALVRDGVAPEDARNWTAGGCMEVSTQGANCDLLFSFAHNVARTFELVINGGCLMQTGERVIGHEKTLKDYQDYDELFDDFSTELQRELDILLKRLDIYLDAYAKYRPSFLLSSMTNDCLKKGRGINAGGARYMDYGGSGVGIPDVGDSLFAIRKLVFETGQVDAGNLLNALRNNFSGYEALRTMLLGQHKYGDGHGDALDCTSQTLGVFVDKLHSHKNRYGGHCRVVILGFFWVVRYGAMVGAMPDGRLAGEPLAHGLTPCNAALANGITTGMNSVTNLDLEKIAGGASTMWDIAEECARPEILKPLILAYFRQGGHIFQGNMISVQSLKEAIKHPDRFRNLFVRVGGYSARFTTLDRDTQEEIVKRTKHRK